MSVTVKALQITVALFAIHAIHAFHAISDAFHAFHAIHAFHAKRPRADANPQDVKIRKALRQSCRGRHKDHDDSPCKFETLYNSIHVDWNWWDSVESDQ